MVRNRFFWLLGIFFTLYFLGLYGKEIRNLQLKQFALEAAVAKVGEIQKLHDFRTFLDYCNKKPEFVIQRITATQSTTKIWVACTTSVEYLNPCRRDSLVLGRTIPYSKTGFQLRNGYTYNLLSPVPHENIPHIRIVNITAYAYEDNPTKKESRPLTTFSGSFY